MKKIKLLLLLILSTTGLAAQQGHSIKLGYMVTRGPSHQVSLGYEGTLAERWSLAPAIGFTGASGTVSNAGQTYSVSSYGQTLLFPVRYYPWYSQPAIKAGPFVSGHLQHEFASASIKSFAGSDPAANVSASVNYLGMGLGAGWKAGIGRFSLEAYFDLTFLGGVFGNVAVIDPDPVRVRISAFPYLNYAGGISAGIQL